MEFYQLQRVHLWQDGLVHPFGLLWPTSLKGEMQHQDGSSDSPVESQMAALVIVLGCSPSHSREFAAPFFGYLISPSRKLQEFRSMFSMHLTQCHRNSNWEKGKQNRQQKVLIQSGHVTCFGLSSRVNSMLILESTFLTSHLPPHFQTPSRLSCLFQKPIKQSSKQNFYTLGSNQNRKKMWKGIFLYIF